jgi:hypothetical protein
MNAAIGGYTITAHSCTTVTVIKIIFTASELYAPAAIITPAITLIAEVIITKTSTQTQLCV